MIRFLFIKAFCWLTMRLFNTCAVWCDAEGSPRVWYLADNIRDLNCATRDYVEALDNSYNYKKDN